MDTRSFAPGTPEPLLARTMDEWQAQGGDLWIFGYASLIWRPDLPYTERRRATVHGWHRALQMWSHVNRGTPERPGLVFALLSGGSCQGVVFRVPRERGEPVLRELWQREMPRAVYDPRWLRCRTAAGSVQALGFTLSRRSTAYTGTLPDAQYRQIFAQARGVYGSTREYAEATHAQLERMGIRDVALTRVIELARSGPPAGTITP